MTIKQSTLKGFRDFLPEEKRQRDFVMKKIKQTFEIFGFEPFFKDRGGRQVALRFDQTVPTARLLAQYKNKLPKYFRRYQLQNVFRSDKPQKGRYREFTQCDIDIFGSTSPLSDAEIIACTYFSFKNVGFPNIILRLNDRQILFNVLKPFGSKKLDVLSIIQTVDKLDKKPESDVIKELINKGLTSQQTNQALKAIKQAKISDNLNQIITLAQDLGVPQKALEFSPILARGLDYYTGMIFEVVLPEYQLGSFAGGGRYDQLINQLSGVNIPAVGIAFGFDRMVEAATKLNLIPKTDSTAKVLVTTFPGYLTQSLKTAKKLRMAGIETEVYLEEDNLNKQFKLANDKNIPYVIVIGPDEAKANKVTLKDMKSGKQQTLSLGKIIEKLQN